MYNVLHVLDAPVGFS